MKNKDSIQIEERGKANEEIVFLDLADEQKSAKPKFDWKKVLQPGLKLHLAGGLALVLFLLIFLSIFLKPAEESNPSEAKASFNLNLLDNYDSFEEVIYLDRPLREAFTDMLLSEKIAYAWAQQAQSQGIDRLGAGAALTWYFADENAQVPAFLSYAPDPYRQYIFDANQPTRLHEFSYQPQKSLQKEFWVLKADMMELLTQEKDTTSLTFSVISEVEQILAWSIGLRSLVKGDTIGIVWYQPPFKGIVPDTAREIKALYLGAKAVDQPIYAYQFEHGGQSDFYDEKGRSWKRKFLRSPVKYGRISSRYNLSRIHPLLKQIKPHKGTDFAAPMRTDILALADGVVDKIGKNQFNGKYISIRHDDIYRTMYLHASSIPQHLRKGSKVQQGDVIAYVGSTGSSSGPHVCLRFFRREHQDDFVRAFPYLPTGESLPAEVLPNFHLERTRIDQFLR